MLAKDTNEMCDGDGETTAGLLKLIVFTLITCTVYNYIWHYKLMNRIQNNAERYGVKAVSYTHLDVYKRQGGNPGRVRYYDTY